MRAQDDRAAFILADAVDQLLHLARGVGIHARGGFIQKQQFGIVQQGARQRQALLHALTVSLHAVIGTLAQSQRIQVKTAAFLDLGRAHISQRAEEMQVLPGREAFVQRRRLGQHARTAADGRAPGSRVQAQHRAAARSGAQQTVQQANGGGLSSAVRPQQSENLALPYAKTHAAQRLEVSVSKFHIQAGDHIRHIQPPIPRAILQRINMYYTKSSLPGFT